MKRSLALNSRRIKNLNSGLGKGKRACAAQMRYFQKRKHLLSSRINLHQKAFEELQISYTCSDPSESPMVLTPFDVKVCDTSEDIQDEISDRYVSVTVASVPPAIQEHSKNQSSRFTSQRFLTFFYNFRFLVFFCDYFAVL